jgi:hemoglobin-like flavoprotein
MQAVGRRGDRPSHLDHPTDGENWAADAALVKGSFDRIWPKARHAADVFYDRLFEIAPHVRPLFRSDLAEQKQKFMATLAILVGSLDEIAELLPRADRLARQHLLYGVHESHYTLVGQALFWTLERELGADWTPAVAAAWRRTYEAVAGYMIQGSNATGT